MSDHLKAPARNAIARQSLAPDIDCQYVAPLEGNTALYVNAAGVRRAKCRKFKKRAR